MLGIGRRGPLGRAEAEMGGGEGGTGDAATGPTGAMSRRMDGAPAAILPAGNGRRGNRPRWSRGGGSRLVRAPGRRIRQGAGGVGCGDPP